MNCVDCGSEFEVSSERYRVAQHGWTMPRRCPKCRHERRLMVDVMCSRCWQTYQTDQGRLRHLEERGYNPLCDSCRQALYGRRSA